MHWLLLWTTGAYLAERPLTSTLFTTLAAAEAYLLLFPDASLLEAVVKLSSWLW